MNKALFALLYLAALAVPGWLYLAPLGGPALVFSDAYALSTLLGTTAYAILATQFLLAARPRWVVRALGIKALLSLHGTMATAGITLAVAHRVLKINVVGYPDDTAQARLGLAALLVFFIVILAAAFLMANTFWQKIPAFKRLKEGLYARFKLTYPRMRVFHNLSVLAGLVLTIHVLLAASSAWADNSAGFIWMSGWMLVCLGAYARYRLAGRKTALVRYSSISTMGGRSTAEMAVFSTEWDSPRTRNATWASPNSRSSSASP